MSEHKSVIIDIEETEKTRIGELSKMDSIETNGVLSVNNVSERARIWNVRVLLGDSRSGTDIEADSLPAGEVDVGGKWETDYSVDVKAPILTLTEIYDTCGEVARSLLTLTVRNTKRKSYHILEFFQSVGAKGSILTACQKALSMVRLSQLLIMRYQGKSNLMQHSQVGNTPT